MALSDKLNPTYYGYIGSTKDALLIIQATLNNQLLAVPRRPHDKERNLLIQSGNIFVFIEERSGIKRWTDGIAWSPSRILGRFLIYRELDRLALNNNNSNNSDANFIKDEPLSSSSISASSSIKRKRRKKFESVEDTNAQQQQRQQFDQISNLDTDDLKANEAYNNSGSNNGSVTNRALVGSLVTSYAFKDRGLIKKTLSVTISSQKSQQQLPHHDSLPIVSTETIHLVSYYNADDVVNGVLKRPSDSPNLKDLQISVLLYNALRETTLGTKTPSEDEGFYFFDANNNLVSMPNPTAKSIAAKQQQQQQQQQASPTLSTTGAPTTAATTTTNFPIGSSIYPTRLLSIHDPYHTQNLVPQHQEYPYAFNHHQQQQQQQQQQRDHNSSSISQPQYWQQQQQIPFYGTQPMQQYWQSTPAPAPQPREGSFSSLASNKRNSPIFETSSTSSSYNMSISQPPPAPPPLQQQLSSNYNSYPNQYHSSQIPKFVQSQIQYLPQQQQQQYQIPPNHQYSYMTPYAPSQYQPTSHQLPQQIPPMTQQQPQQPQQPSIMHLPSLNNNDDNNTPTTLASPMIATNGDGVNDLTRATNAVTGATASPSTTNNSGPGQIPVPTTTASTATTSTNGGGQQRFFGYQV